MSNQTPLELWQVEAWGYATTAPEQVRAIASELLEARATISALRSSVAELEAILRDGERFVTNDLDCTTRAQRDRGRRFLINARAALTKEPT